MAGTNLSKLHSMPSYHGWYVALWCGIPSGIVLIVWLIIEAPILEALLLSYLGPEVADQSEAMIGLLLNDVRNLASGDVVSREVDPALQAAADRYASMKSTAHAAVLAIGVALAGAGFGWAWRRIAPGLRARNKVERVVNIVLILSSCVAIVTTIGIVLSVLFESIRFFSIIPFWDFLFGLKWSPQTAIRADQVGSTGAFGAIPLFTGTLMITLIAMLVALPVGLFAAIYMAEFASPRLRNVTKPILGDPGRRADRGLRLLCGPGGGARNQRIRRVDRPRRRLRERARRRRRHGHHDHPLHLVAERRRHRRRAQLVARRLARHGRDQVGNGGEGDPAGGAAGDRRRLSARGPAAPSARP